MGQLTIKAMSKDTLAALERARTVPTTETLEKALAALEKREKYLRKMAGDFNSRMANEAEEIFDRTRKEREEFQYEVDAAQRDFHRYRESKHEAEEALAALKNARLDAEVCPTETGLYKAKTTERELYVLAKDIAEAVEIANWSLDAEEKVYAAETVCGPENLRAKTKELLAFHG